ncbi:MAG: Gfo/Idh/MocA family oxidoreductase [candidate division WS1 bacterium]|jgi:predicted dehydrogenase|nr:Gfo/Idh/MocA family oxidoreductase [candidate division WS1 bacterium]
MEKIGFGVIGCGNISGTHRKAIESVEMAELVACCDVVEEKAKAWAEEAGIGSNYHRDLEEMLARDDIQAVSVCTPSGMHSEHAIMAAQAGKHILCEKPLDVTLKKIDDMIAAADRANVKMSGVFQRRTYESTKKVREVVRTGKLGKLVLGDCYQKYFRSHEYYASGDWRATWDLDGGGALMNQGVHGIDLILHLMGPVKSVSAICRRLVRNLSVEDTAVAVLEYENGALGVLEGTTSVTPGSGCEVEISGDNGTVGLSGDTITKWQIKGEEAEGEEAGEEGTASDPLALGATGHSAHVLDLCQSIIEDREPAIPGREARKAVELIKAIYKSSREGGAPVTLPLSYVDDGPGI